MLTIKEIVKDQTAVFQYFHDGALWYMSNGFLFPVPVEDAKSATFNAEEKAMLLMRYIRKYHNKMTGNEEVKSDFQKQHDLEMMQIPSQHIATKYQQ